MNENIINESFRIIESGGVILYPSDTIWGIGCDATNEKSIKTDAKEPGIATTRTERIRGEKCANYRSYDSVVFD